VLVELLRDAGAFVAFHARHPSVPTILVLAGTDIYPAPSPEALESIHLADRLVALHDRAIAMIPADARAKARTITQSAEAFRPPAPGDAAPFFEVCVVGHLRRVKDPLRAAAAARLLPSDSRVRIRHAGRILEDDFTALVAREQPENPRYTWLGPLSARQARDLIASSDLQVLSSLAEGGAQVLGESVVSGTPLLASRHDAALSLLGEDYPGLFDIGATAQLAALMTKAETNSEFRALLRERTASLAPQFDPRREREAWRALLAELAPESA
jgi:glycosyltransferase involved in cell wall biosynthesis